MALCLAYPADDTQPKPQHQASTQNFVDLDDAPYDDLALAESAQWGGGRGWGGGGRGWGGGGWGGGGGRGWGGGGGWGGGSMLYKF